MRQCNIMKQKCAVEFKEEEKKNERKKPLNIVTLTPCLSFYWCAALPDLKPHVKNLTNTPKIVKKNTGTQKERCIIVFFPSVCTLMDLILPPAPLFRNSSILFH